MKFSAENYARKHLLSHTRVEISSRLGKFSSCLVICGQQPVASSLDAQRFRMMNAQPLGNQFQSQEVPFTSLEVLIWWQAACLQTIATTQRDC